MNLWKANFAWLLLPNCDPWSLWCKVVNIIFTPQKHTYIYELLVHESILTLPCTHFVIVGVYPSCTCPNFLSNATSFRHSYFLSCKHMHYICNVHLNLVGDLQMHQPSLNYNDVKNILKLDPFELFCATWLHIWEYSFHIHGLKFSDVSQMFMDFWFSIIFM
jgi:hypothetical protein